MPDATITSTASTFGTISGTFAADQSTITGTITAITGTVDGSVGVPGPQGPAGAAGPQGPQGDPGAPGQGVAAGGTTGQVLQKLSATSYDTGWLTLPADYITSVTAPLAVASGNLSVNLSAYLPLAGGYITGDIQSSNGSGYRSWNGTNLTGIFTAGSIVFNDTTPGHGSLTLDADGLTFNSSPYKQTTPFLGLAGYATEAWVTNGFYPLAGNPSGFLTDAPSNGSQYARKNGAWDVVTTTPDFITSVSSPLSVMTGNLSVDLSTYLTSATAASTYQTLAGMSSYLTTATAASTYAVIAAGQPVAGSAGQVLTKQSGTNWDSIWATPVVGDRYLTTSTTSLTINNANKTLTVGTGLSYTPTQNITISYDASNHMHGEVLTYNSGTGVLTVDINHHTGSGTYAAWVVNVGGVTPATSVAFADITGAVSSNANLQAALDLKANLASPALTGNVTITSNSAGAALFIEQAGAGNILTLHDQASDTTFVAIDQSGKVNTIASVATSAGFNVPHGAAPSTPVNGDIWTTTSGLFARINAGTQQYMSLANTQTVSGNITFSNASQTLGNSTATSTINVGSGATTNGLTKTVNVATGGVVGSTTNIIVGPVLGYSTTSIGGTTDASTLNLATGATLTATVKAVNIGTSGVAGSTTNIAIGSTTGTSTTTLQGTTNGVTRAVDTNSVALATTAFVVGQAGSATPLVDGTAAVGTSLRYARQDHVHGTDTTRAAVDSQVFTGTPTLPTGTIAVTQSPGDNTTAVATTAFVTAAVPAFATSTQSRAATSATVAQSPNSEMWQMMNPGFIRVNRAGHTYTATGTMGTFTAGWYSSLMNVGAGIASARFRSFGTSQVDQSNLCISKGYRSYIDFSRYIWCSGRFYTDNGAWSDPNVSARFYFGKAENSGTGDPARKCFGWSLPGNATAANRNPVLQVHNGTTLTSVATTFAVVGQQYFDWDIVSLGNGTVTLYINGTQYATTSAGPTGDTSYGGTAPVIWQEELVATAVPTLGSVVFSRGQIYIAP